MLVYVKCVNALLSFEQIHYVGTLFTFCFLLNLMKFILPFITALPLCVHFLQEKPLNKSLQRGEDPQFDQVCKHHIDPLLFFKSTF